MLRLSSLHATYFAESPLIWHFYLIASEAELHKEHKERFGNLETSTFEHNLDYLFRALIYSAQFTKQSSDSYLSNTNSVLNYNLRKVKFYWTEFYKSPKKASRRDFIETRIMSLDLRIILFQKFQTFHIYEYLALKW